jgi:hypothetical protein
MKIYKITEASKYLGVLIKYKDSLARFGYEYLEAIFSNLEIQVDVMEAIGWNMGILMHDLILASLVGWAVIASALLSAIVADCITRRYTMRFRVSQTISDEALNDAFFRHAKAYAAWVLIEGCMGGHAMKARREMMQHYEEIQRRKELKSEMDSLQVIPWQTRKLYLKIPIKGYYSNQGGYHAGYSTDWGLWRTALHGRNVGRMWG